MEGLTGYQWNHELFMKQVSKNMAQMDISDLDYVSSDLDLEVNNFQKWWALEATAGKAE